MIARVQHREQPGRDQLAPTAASAPTYSAGPDDRTGSGEIACQRCDHEHGFEALAEQNDGGLQIGRTWNEPVLGCFIAQAIQ